MLTMAATGLLTWFWSSKAAVAAQAPAPTAIETPVPSGEPGEPGKQPGKQPGKHSADAAPAKSLAARTTSQPKLAGPPRRSVPAPVSTPPLLPKRTPQEIVAKLNAATNDYLQKALETVGTNHVIRLAKQHLGPTLQG